LSAEVYDVGYKFFVTEYFEAMCGFFIYFLGLIEVDIFMPFWSLSLA